MHNNNSGLTPIKTQSLTDQVEKTLVDYFKSNNFKTGDALPKEVELAENLGVSRNIVREALSRLRMLGIIESKKRKGMILSEPDILSGISRILDPSFLSEGSLKDIFELRLVLEVGMADLLFARKTEEDVDKLIDIATREKKDPDCVHSQEVRTSYEIEFHSQLYSLSGNNTLSRFQGMLLPVFNYMMEIESHLDQEPPRGSVSHFDLIETLKNGDPRQFRENMRDHLTPHYARL